LEDEEDQIRRLVNDIIGKRHEMGIKNNQYLGKNWEITLSFSTQNGRTRPK